MKVAVFVSILLATPAAADTAALMASPDTRIAGVLEACLMGAKDPKAAEKLFISAGYAKTEGEDDGSYEYTLQGAPSVMMWDEPGFCMITTRISTKAMAKDLTAMAPAKTGKDQDGCHTFTLTSGIVATLNGPGNDPACEDSHTAAVRFALPQ